MVHYGICKLLAYPSVGSGLTAGYISQLSLKRSQLTVNFSTLCAGCLCWGRPAGVDGKGVLSFPLMFPPVCMLSDLFNSCYSPLAHLECESI